MTPKTCDFEWPKGESELHRCAEKAGHGDWHVCRCSARKDADLVSAAVTATVVRDDALGAFGAHKLMHEAAS